MLENQLQSSPEVRLRRAPRDLFPWVVSSPTPSTSNQSVSRVVATTTTLSSWQSQATASRLRANKASSATSRIFKMVFNSKLECNCYRSEPQTCYCYCRRVWAIQGVGVESWIGDNVNLWRIISSLLFELLENQLQSSPVGMFRKRWRSDIQFWLSPEPVGNGRFYNCNFELVSIFYNKSPQIST